jgi:hypothetical protein
MVDTQQARCIEPCSGLRAHGALNWVIARSSVRAGAMRRAARNCLAGNVGHHQRNAVMGHSKAIVAIAAGFVVGD